MKTASISLIAIIGIAIIGLVLLLEMGLRLLFGFGNPLLYVADDAIGYLLAPNQQVRRFGNRTMINQYSMRSAEVTLERSPDTLRILLLGDSIANGSWWTDQDDIISEILRQQIQSVLTRTPFNRVEVLNASANSWGPRNELAYLKRFGHFNAQVIVLLINTDDLFATAPSSMVVGRDRSYPNRKPPSALAEIFTRYLGNPSAMSVDAPKEEGDRVGANLEAVRQIKTITVEANGQFVLALTPLARELGTPGPRDYELKARKRLSEFVAQEHIPYLDFLPEFNGQTDPKRLYRDHIHLTPDANRLVSQRITEIVQNEHLSRH